MTAPQQAAAILHLAVLTRSREASKACVSSPRGNGLGWASGKRRRAYQDLWGLDGQCLVAEIGAMQAESLTLAQLLAVSALIGGTIQYAELVKRRVKARREAAMRDETADTGLRGLVRVFLASEATEPEPSGRS